MPKVVIIKERDKRASDHRQARHSQNEKYQAVVVYLATGNWAEVTRQTGVSYDTLMKWRKTSWWDDKTKEIKEAHSQEVQTKLKNLTNKTLENLDERLTNGDYIYNPKEDKIVRVPVRAKDLNSIAKDTIDKQLLLDKFNQALLNNQKERDEGIMQRLDILKQEFQKFAKSKSYTQVLHEGDIIDVESLEDPDAYSLTGPINEDGGETREEDSQRGVTSHA